MSKDYAHHDHLLCIDSATQCCKTYWKRATLPIAMDDVRCMSTESKLSQCPHVNSHNHNCGHSEDVGVICQKRENLACCQRVSIVHYHYHSLL